MRGAAHKPGAFPLRPLGLGDIYDAAFKIIRFNPKATVGSAVLVAAIAMVLPVLATAALSAVADLSFPTTTGPTTGPAAEPTPPTTSELLGFAGVFGSLMVGSILQGIGLVLVTGMIARVVMASATGRRLSLGQAWAATHGRRWRLIGLTLLLGLVNMVVVAIYTGMWVIVIMASQGWELPVLWGVISVPAFIAFMFWLWIRVCYLPPSVLMIERSGIFAAIGRGFELTSGRFWRTFGIALLTVLITQIGGSILVMPISFLAQGLLMAGAPGEAEMMIFMLAQALSTVITAAFVTPFTGAVTSLLYVDLRMRKEAFDVELMQRAGITAG